MTHRVSFRAFNQSSSHIITESGSPRGIRWRIAAVACWPVGDTRGKIHKDRTFVKTYGTLTSFVLVAHHTTNIIKMLLVFIFLLLNCSMPSEQKLSQQLRNDKLQHKKNVIQMIIWTSVKNIGVANVVKMRYEIPNRQFNVTLSTPLCIISIFGCSQRAWTPLQYKDHLSRHRDPHYLAKDIRIAHIVKQHACIDEITTTLKRRQLDIDLCVGLPSNRRWFLH